MFVFGFDVDTEKTVRATVRFAIKEKIETAQFLILTPLPGTQFFHEMTAQHRIIDRHWTHYDAHHVKFKPAHFSGYALQWAQIRAHARFYSPFRVLARLFRGRAIAFLLGLYAHSLNRQWKRVEYSYLQMLKYYSRVYG
jgi:radical SAM superfamily enzyme YgiQ (UPF0313 family)